MEKSILFWHSSKVQLESEAKKEILTKTPTNKSNKIWTVLYIF